MCRLLRVGLQLAAILAVCPLAVWAADAPIRHRLMFFEYGNCPNRFVELDTNGKIVREFKPRSIAVIFQVLPNGSDDPVGRQKNRRVEIVLRKVSA